MTTEQKLREALQHSTTAADDGDRRLVVFFDSNEARDQALEALTALALPPSQPEPAVPATPRRSGSTAPMLPIWQ